MFPILYEQIAAGTVPQHYGLGTLSDAISCVVEQERNGIYELTMEYPATGIHAQDIAQRRILKVKPNFTDVPQLFRIDRVGKTMNGVFTCYAKHISYDLSGYVITSGTANNAESACKLLSDATKTDGENPDFIINTTKTVLAEFNITTPSSVKSWFGGKEGSLLDVYGTGEWKYNNFTCSLMVHAGVTEPRTTIRYGKNLLELSQEIDSSKLFTDVLCFYKSEDALVSGNKVTTGLTLDVPKCLVVDVTSQFQNVPTTEDLDDAAQDYIDSHNLTVPTNNITLDFVQSGELTTRVDLCDVVDVYYEALGITRARVKCIRTKWDCIREKYIETEFGDVKQSLADTISDATSAISDIASLAGDKKRVFVNTPTPPYNIGDLWVNDGTIYYCIEGKKETITEEKSGSIATFHSFLQNELIECKANIEGSQDLNGYTRPWAGGTGKNKLNYDVWKEVTVTRGTAVWENNGVTLTASSNDCYTNPWADDYPVNARIAVSEGETYTLSWQETTNANGLVFIFGDATTSSMVSVNNNVRKYLSYTVPSGVSFITFRFGVTNAGETISFKNIQIEKSDSATAFEPYSNVCPIIGFTDANIARMGKNLLKNTVTDNHSNSVYWVVNDDKSITLSGTASGTVFISLAAPYYLPSGKYTMSKSGHSGIQMLLRVGTISGIDIFWGTELNDRTATIAAGIYAPLIRIASGTNCDGITLYPQMQAGDSATDYETYTAEVYDVDIRINKGVNIWDEDWESGGIDTDTGLPVTDNSKIRSKNFTEVEPNTDYYFVYKDGNLVVIFYDENYAVISYTGRGLKTTPANCHYVKLRMGSMASPVTEYAYNTGINYPATDTSYHAHNGDPVYKGELNVTTGELTLSHAFIDLGDLSYSKTGILYSKYAFLANVDNLKPVTNTADYIDAVCESYTIRSGNQVYSAWEGLSAWSTQQKIGIYDSTKESLTASEFKTAVSGIKFAYELNEPITVNVDAQQIQTLIGLNNLFTDTNGDVYVKYYVQGFAFDDWQLATDFVDETNLEDSIRNATQIITGGLGGNVIINYRDVTVDGRIMQRPFEILILCDADNIDDATQLWRWNSGGLGYSQTGYDGEYGTAMSVDPVTGKGYINADFITVGTLDASLVTIQDLTATMFTGNTIVLGGSDNSKLEVQDASGNPLIRVNKNGMECFAATVNNITPSVVFDKNGVTGYSNSADKENTAIFWTKKDNFHMVNAVIENEASFGGKIRFVPITVGNFEGIAVVPVIDN